MFGRLLLFALLLGACVPAGDDDDSIFAGDDDDSTWTDLLPDHDDEDQVATLQGDIVRAVPATDDGIGDLYLFAYAEDPTGTENKGDPPLSLTHFYDADLVADGSAVAYSLEVPVGDEPLYLLAIFDDDHSGLKPEPGPGDLLSMGPGGAPSILVDVGDTVFSLDLSLTMTL